MAADPEAGAAPRAGTAADGPLPGAGAGLRAGTGGRGGGAAAAIEAGSEVEAAGAGPLIVLDVSRLVSRIGLGPATGIDRVELAWLRALQGRPHALLARVPRRQLLLGPEAGPLLAAWLADPARMPPPGGAVAWLRRAHGPRARAEEALARMARSRGTTSGWGLRLPPGAAWLNVGHANLAPGPWRALRGHAAAVLIHDTIPLDHPGFTRPDQTGAFRRRLMAALGHAGLILTVSEASRADVLRWQARLSPVRRVPVIAVPIGTDLAPAEPDAVPAGLRPDGPYLVALGTIEPRKNHALLLDAWALLARRLPAGARVPRLLILGRRGWLNEALFARLDSLPADGPVIERAGLGDGAVAALLEGAHGLLMPSHAEGFGLPLTEAAARGVPVLATPLPAAREVLGAEGAEWLPADDPAPWAEAVARLAATPSPPRRPPLAAPGWNAHVTTVLRHLAALEIASEVPCPAGIDS